MDLKHIKSNFIEPQKGRLLISEPFLLDFHFRRTVILLGEHNEDGTVGFVLNRLLSVTSNDVAPDLLDHNFPLFYGGPVEPNTLHFIHKAGSVIAGSIEIAEGIFWGGDISLVNDFLNKKIVTPDEFRFFVGYSGWAPEQLKDEIECKSWWVTEQTPDVIFDDDLENMWKKIVSSLGQDFAYLANSPEDPTWN